MTWELRALGTVVLLVVAGIGVAAATARDPAVRIGGYFLAGILAWSMVAFILTAGLGRG